jgi:hypothetical protein
MKSIFAISLTTLSLFTTASAWAVGLWGTDGRNFQDSGFLQGRCIAVNLPGGPIHLGQITFDVRTRGWPAPSRVVVYGDKSCDPDFKIDDIGNSRTGVTVPKTTMKAKSYKVI